MRSLIAAAMLAAFVGLAFNLPQGGPPPALLAGKCVGADPCRACVSCRSCKHCRGGSTCGACKPKKGERALAYFADPMCRSPAPPDRPHAAANVTSTATPRAVPAPGRAKSSTTRARAAAIEPLAAGRWLVASVHDGDTITALDASNVQHKLLLDGD